jgi:hypothetical protein
MSIEFISDESRAGIRPVLCLAIGIISCVSFFSATGSEAQVPNAGLQQVSIPVKVGIVGILPARIYVEDSLSTRELSPEGKKFQGIIYFGRNRKIPDSLYIDYGKYGIFRLPIQVPKVKRQFIPLQVDVRTLYDFCTPARAAELSMSSTAPLIVMRRFVQGRLLAAMGRLGCKPLVRDNLIRGLAGHNSFLAERWDFIAMDSELFTRSVPRQSTVTAGSRAPGPAVANIAHRLSKPSLRARIAVPEVRPRPALRPKN